MLLYLFTIQMIAFAATTIVVRSRNLAIGLTGAVFTCLALASGYIVQVDEVGIWGSWIKYASPQVINTTVRIFATTYHSCNYKCFKSP